MNNSDALPIVLAGPIIRKVTPKSIAIWIASPLPCQMRIELSRGDGDAELKYLKPEEPGLSVLKAGERLYFHLVDFSPIKDLPEQEYIHYRLSLRPADDDSAGWQDHSHWAPDICYPGRASPCFKVPKQVDALLHGSCRKPHGQCSDGLAGADKLLSQHLGAPTSGTAEEPLKTPSLLILSGDQVYVDDVAGPMLQAIGALVDVLGLPDERLTSVAEGFPKSGHALNAAGGLLYHRDTILPKIHQNTSVFDVLFGGTRKPIFTTQHARNHLITLGEMLAMYLLVWSPAVWDIIPDPVAPDSLNEDDAVMYAGEKTVLQQFISDLPACRRVLAHLSTAMIFDDHDITDDWNLSIAWEQAAYGHPLSRRVIGNALLAYAVCQGWGNRPNAIHADLAGVLSGALQAPGTEKHDSAIDALLEYEGWDFQWQTDPPLIVLDTRTRRWRSEKRDSNPSGLLDWEAATDLQGHLRGKDAVLLVSAAPIFGVKLIETIQKFFTIIGKPLMVDAEYWMAHSGTANAILNVFRHRSTPRHFVILSGDVHYSYVYDVELRQKALNSRREPDEGPNIWQICSSGIKNTWPDRLISILDQTNRWAFSPRSPLNWFTKRRGMRVIPRKPLGTPHGRRILNASGIGLVELSEDGAPVRICQVLPDATCVPFERREKEARLD